MNTDVPRLHLDRSTRKLVLTSHVLASVGWFGIAVVVAFCGLAAAATDDALLADALHRTMQTAPWLSVPIGLMSVASGAVLGLGTTWGLVRHRWVVVKIMISIAVILTDAVLVNTAARESVRSGRGSGPLYGPTIAHVVVLAVAVVLSIYKPRGRTRFGRRGAPPQDAPDVKEGLDAVTSL